MESLPSLPESVLDEIFAYLSFLDRRHLVAVCSCLWQLRRSLEGKILQLRLDGEELNILNEILLSQIIVTTSSESFQICRGFQFKCLQNYSSLQILELGPFAFDEKFFEALPVLPSLKHFGLRGHPTLNDSHLESLTEVTEKLPALESLDITFCPETTFAGTGILRESFPKLKIVRRQPEWLDGHFVTPFGRNEEDGEDEIHTYWPDGQFKFSRTIQSCGFSCDTKAVDGDSNFVTRTLRYNNFIPPDTWPSWTRFVYKPGVSLMKLDDEIIPSYNSSESDNSDAKVVHSVLVAQYITGSRETVTDRNLMERAKLCVPLGESRYYDSEGNMYTSADVDVVGFREPILTMISRMQTIPFQSQEERCSGPPLDVVVANKRFFAEFPSLKDLKRLEKTFYSRIAIGGR